MTHSRNLLWSCGDQKNVRDTLFKDATGAFIVNGTTPNTYWVSFLDGRQRVLLFTNDLAIATIAQAYETERIEQQISLSLSGIGISLVDNMRNAEIAFIAITTSGAIWEFKGKKNRYKALSLKENVELDKAYVKYVTEKAQGKKGLHSRQKVDKIDIDFETMDQYKPQERKLRRTYVAGLFFQYKTSAHQQHVHLKLNHFQIDNHLPMCVFPVVFAPVPLPKSVAAESIPKPLIEVSYVARIVEHSNVPQIKYFKVLVQEVALQADQGFLNALLRFGGSDQQTSHYTVDLYQKDYNIVNQKLESFAVVASSAEQKAYYDLLHFSPIKLHLSFSQGGNLEDDPVDNKKSINIQSEFLNLLLKSVGVTLTEIQDIVFKLAFFERNGVFLSRPQLTNEITQHYVTQAIKQAYVLILGLDIIGNPFGLIRDLSTGVETFFYEPFQGAVQGPEEFAEGLALGVKSLFGHAVGGAAGAVSRITGTLGKGLAALTMDEEYQKKRQEMMNRRPANVGEGIMQGGKGLVMGVYDGVTGVFVKPIEGAKKEGVSGFAKGLGKGIIGAFTRPTSGIVDFASSTFDTMKKVTDVSSEVSKRRPPRLMYPDKIIRPYVMSEAEGNQMLHSLEKGKYKTTDYYIGRGAVTADEKFYFVVTDKRVLLVGRNDLFGSFDVEWEYKYDELCKAPYLSQKGLEIPFKEPTKKTLGIFGRSSAGKLVHFEDERVAKQMEEKCQRAFSMQS